MRVEVALADARKRVPNFVYVNAYVPDDIATLGYTPSQQVAQSLSVAGECIARADSRVRKSAAGSTQIVGLLARSEGIGSSTIEGYNASLEKIVVESAMEDRSHTTTTAGIIRDGIESVAYALDTLGDPANPISAAAIEHVQRGLMANQGGHLRGYRRTFVQIGGNSAVPETADFIPPPWQDVLGLMEDLCDFINREDFVHPIAKAAIAHAQFETIHPFPDGNGRTGRALFQAMLRRSGLMAHAVLPLSAAIAKSDESRRRYVAALGGVRDLGSLDQTVESFCDFVVTASLRTESLVDETEAALEELRATVASQFRSDSVAHRLVELLVKHVGITANGAARMLGATPQSVRTALNNMEHRKVVASRAGGKASRVYFAPAILSVIAEASGSAVHDHALSSLPNTSMPWDVLTGPPRGRPQRGKRCGVPLRTGGTCMRPAGHGTTGHRSKP